MIAGGLAICSPLCRRSQTSDSLQLTSVHAWFTYKPGGNTGIYILNTRLRRREGDILSGQRVVSLHSLPFPWGMIRSGNLGLGCMTRVHENYHVGTRLSNGSIQRSSRNCRNQNTGTQVPTNYTAETYFYDGKNRGSTFNDSNAENAWCVIEIRLFKIKMT